MDTKQESLIFDPQPDITAYELAQLVPLLIPSRFRDIEKAVEKLPSECKRHVRMGSNEVAD